MSSEGKFASAKSWVFEEARKLADRIAKSSKKEAILETYLDRADALSRSLIDYKIAVIEVTNAELDDAVDIFSRINSKGRVLTDFALITREVAPS